MCSLKCPTVEPYIAQIDVNNMRLNKISHEQIDVLLDFYDSLNGENWIIQGNWLNMSVSVYE